MYKTLQKAWSLVESPAGLVAAIFTVAIFLYSTFATSSDLEKADARITRGMDFQNKERDTLRIELKEAVNGLRGEIQNVRTEQQGTNRILTDILLESKKR